MFSQLLSFFLVVYLARVLGPADYGDINMAIAIVSYFNLIATFGLSTVGLREVAGAQGLFREKVDRIFSLRIWLAVFSYGLLVLLGLLFIADMRLLHLVLLYGLGILVAAFLIDWVFVGMEDLRSLAVANVGSNVLGLAGIFLFVRDASDIYYIPAILTLASVFSCIYLLRLYVGFHPVHICCRLPEFAALLRMSAPMAVTGLLSQVYGNVDMILIGIFVGSAEVGYYSVAYKVVFVISGIIGIYSQSTLPVMVRLFGTDRVLLGEFVQQNLHTVVYFMLPLLTGGTLLAEPIISLFFGEAYAQSATAFSILLFYLFFMAISITLANMVLASKADNLYLGTLTLGATVNVAANLVLIPHWHSAGAATAMLIAELAVICYLLFRLWALRGLIGLNIGFLAVLAAGDGLMAGCLYWSGQMVQMNALVSIFLGAVVYLGVTWPFCAKYLRRTLTR